MFHVFNPLTAADVAALAIVDQQGWAPERIKTT
jgi:hypothetical protein